MRFFVFYELGFKFASFQTSENTPWLMHFSRIMKNALEITKLQIFIKREEISS